MRKLLDKYFENQHFRTVKYLDVKQLVRAADLRSINKEIERDFNLAAPLMVSFPSAQVHQARWGMMRESYLAHHQLAPIYKEITAATISKINQCPYCQDTHSAGIITLGEQALGTDYLNKVAATKTSELSPFIDWLESIVDPTNPTRNTTYSFPPLAIPELIGTIISFQSINRFVNLFVEKSPLPIKVNNQQVKTKMFQMAAKTFFKMFFFKKVSPKQPSPTVNLPIEFTWSKGHPSIGAAIARELETLDHIASSLDPSCVQIFNEYLDTWDGTTPLGKGWMNSYTNKLPEAAKCQLQQLFIAAFQSYTLVESDITNFRKFYPSDQFLVEVCYYAIQKTAYKLGNDLWANWN